MAVKLKICGLMREEDVDLCCALEVEMLGFVAEYPLSVPWNLKREEAARLMRRVRPPARTCLVTGGTAEDVTALALELRPDFVQLHFRETVADALYITSALTSAGIGVIKTIPADPRARLAQFGVEAPERCAEALGRVGVRAILVDSRTPESAHMPGQPADLALFRSVRTAAQVPVMLAGGVTPENCGALLAAAPDWLDVMTGVERCPGQKDPQRLAAVTAAVKIKKSAGADP